MRLFQSVSSLDMTGLDSVLVDSGSNDIAERQFCHLGKGGNMTQGKDGR